MINRMHKAWRKFKKSLTRLRRKRHNSDTSDDNDHVAHCGDIIPEDSIPDDSIGDNYVPDNLVTDINPLPISPLPVLGDTIQDDYFYQGPDYHVQDDPLPQINPLPISPLPVNTVPDALYLKTLPLSQSQSYNDLLDLTLDQLDEQHLADILEQAAPSHKPDNIQLPNCWTSMHGLNAHRHALMPSDGEYKEVSRHFSRTFGSNINKYNIIEIFRVQNLPLYECYYRRWKDMDNRNPPGTKNQRHLFHGTSVEAIDMITQMEGFEIEKAGSHKGCWYGRGVYFAPRSDKSLCYCPKDEEGYQYMLRCRVLTGEYSEGSSNQIQPPYNPDTGLRYDSLVDNISHPTEFNIFDDDGAYPEYLIIFRNKRF